MQSTASVFSKELQIRESDWLSLDSVDRVRGMILLGRKLIEEG